MRKRLLHAAVLLVALLGTGFVAVAAPTGDDCSVRPGIRLACQVTFRVPPPGQTTILYRPKEYWLRYDPKKDGAGGNFRFWVHADGGWGPFASVRADGVETGRVYRLAAGWNGRDLRLSVDGKRNPPLKRTGRVAANPKATLVQGKPGVADVSNVVFRHSPGGLADFAVFRTRELMPVEG